MTETTKEDIGNMITTMAKSFEDELYGTEQEQLDAEYWHFKWDDSASLEWNVYQFHDLLKLYGSFCRRWEEHHSGSCCVVERVRDKYLMPKIRAFIERMRLES